MEPEHKQPQSEKTPKTIVKRIFSSIDQQPLCSRTRGEKVIFICIKPDCPNHQTQQFYCFLCSEDEQSKHEHKGKTISSESPYLDSKWLELKTDLEAKIQKVDAWTSRYHGLLSLLTKESGIDTIEQDIKRLRDLGHEVSSFYQSQIAAYASEERMIELIATKDKLDTYSTQLKAIPSLEGISL